MKYRVSYAYDLTYYYDFIVEAQDERAARRKAEDALRIGRFRDIRGQPDDTVENERVFVLGRVRSDKKEPKRG